MATPDPFLIEQAPAADPFAITPTPAAPADPFTIAPQQADPFAITPQNQYDALKAVGDDPELDIEPGFESALRGGTANVISSLRVPALMFGETVTEWMEAQYPDSPVTQYFREQTELERGFLAESDATSAATPISQTMQQLAASESVGEFFDTFMESDEKWTAVKELIGLSAPFSAGMILGTAAGGLPGTFSTVFAMDWGDSYRESMRAGKTHDEAMGDATIKALTQAGFDTATMGIARVKLSPSIIRDGLAQMVIQAVGGGSAEAAKHMVVGEDFTTGQVLLEAAGELVTGVPEIAVARATAPSNKNLQELRAALEEVVRKSDLKIAQEELPKLINFIEERLTVAANEDVDNVLDLEKQGVTGKLTGQNLSYIGFGAVNEEQTNAWLSKTLTVNPETGEIETALQSLGTAPVIATQETFLNDKIKERQKVYNEAKIARDEALAMIDEGIGDIATLENVAMQMQEQMDMHNEAIEQLTSQRAQEIDYSNKAVSLLTELQQALMPGSNIIYSTNQAGQVLDEIKNKNQFNLKGPASGRAHHWALHDGTSVIELNLDHFVNETGAVDEANFVEDLVHEFGHAVIEQTYRAQSETTKRALHKAWLKWLKKLLNSTTTEEYYNHRFAPAHARLWYNNSGVEYVPAADEVIDRKQYRWGIDEWTANQLAKSVHTSEVVQGPVRKFFTDLQQKLKELFKMTEGKHKTETTFQDFINLLAAKTALGRVERAATDPDPEVGVEVGRQAMKIIQNISKELGLKVPKGRVPPDVNFPHEADNLNGAIDRWGFFSEQSMALLQWADRNPHITGLRKYVTNVRSWWTDKMKFIARADDRLQSWRKLGDKRAAAVGAFMQDLTVASYDAGKKFGPTDDEFARLVRKHDLDEEQLQMVADIEGDFTAVLDELYAVLLTDAQKTTDPIDQGASIDKLNKDFSALRNRNFFPLSRFGEYYMRVKAKQDMMFEGKEYKAGDVITFEMFEGGTLFTNFSMDTPPALKKREARFRNNDLFEVASGVVNDTQREFAGLPPQLLEMMRDRLDLTEEQKREMDNLLRDIAPGRSFTKHMKTRKNIGGYSSDSLRAYADYFQHFANYVARIKYKGVLQDNINEVTESANIIAAATGNSVKRGRIAQAMRQHFEYVMNPDNEWANLRSFGFLWYLGFVPKSAVVNLTQTGLVTQPFLGARFGDIAAARALTGAIRDAGRAMRSTKRGLREDQNRLIDYLIDTGIIEESMATELAAIAEGRTFARTATNTLFGSQKLGSALRNGAGYGAWLFQTAEKFNRRLTALAAYELVLKKGIPVRDQRGKLTGEFRKATEKEAFLFAQQTVEGTQFEYARFNRPRFMQGKKSVLFLFWQYMQNMLYFTGNDPGAARYIMIMLMAAGLSGLPFSEDLMDIIDFLAKKLNKHFSTTEFWPTNIRQGLRETIADLGANPDLVMHGASRYTMGLPYLADAVGLPMPLVDVSGSLSMGRIVPGIEALTRSDTPMRDDLGRAAEAAGGAVASIPLNLFYAIGDDNPDSWRRWEKATPTIVQHVSKALRYSIRGEATTPEGALIKDFHIPEDKMDLAQVIFQAGGFADTEINRAQEEHYMKKDVLAYYEMRKRLYLEELAYYHRTGERKAFQIVLADIRKYNANLRRLGLGSLAVGPATIRRSITDRAKKRKFIELGIPGGKKGVQVGRDVDEAFTEELRQ